MSKLAIGIIVVIVIIIIVIAAAAMTPKAASAATTLPAGIVNGGVYRCATDGAIYKVQNNQKQHYQPSGYAAAGSPAFTAADCNVLASIPSGADIV